MREKFIRKSVNNIAFFLKSVGINVHQQSVPLLRKIYQFSAISPTVSVFIHLSLYVFVNRNSINDVILVAAFLSSAMTLLATIYFFDHNKNKIFRLLQIMDQNVYRYPDKLNIQYKMSDLLVEKNSYKIHILIIGYEFFGFSLSLLSPALAFLMTGVYETSMYPGWYPVFKKPILILFTTILQSTGCIAAFWIYYVIQVFITSVTIEFLRQYQRLGVTLVNIHEKVKNTTLEKLGSDSWQTQTSIDFDFEFKRRYDINYRENISHCIRHHQQLWKLFLLFEPWYCAFYSMELIMSASTFALVFNNLLSAKNPSTFLTIIGSTFNVLANMFSRCVVGEIFTDMSVAFPSGFAHIAH